MTNRHALFTGLISTLLMSGCIHKPLVNPQVTIPANVSSSDIQKSIHKAFDKYGWVVDKEVPGVTTAHLQQGKLFASVRVVYDQRVATIEYQDTKNIWHEKTTTGEHIHSRYLVWVKNIAESLNSQLNSISQKH